MKAWMTKALELLSASLVLPKHELNELDWKAAVPTQPTGQRNLPNTCLSGRDRLFNKTNP